MGSQRHSVPRVDR